MRSTSLIDHAAKTSSVSKVNPREATSPLEWAMITIGPAYGSLGGSIPDHVVGAPLKLRRPPEGPLHDGPIPDHVVGAPLKPPRCCRKVTTWPSDPRPRGRGPVEALRPGARS